MTALCREESPAQPLPGERRWGCDVEERARRMADFPLSAAAGAEVFQDYDRQFEEGLELVLAGIGTAYAMTYGKSS
ncbi:TetR/AcrR family transcriptional regulator C-terminal domain-containing protein [Streptomyces sp. B21-083]